MPTLLIANRAMELQCIQYVRRDQLHVRVHWQAGPPEWIERKEGNTRQFL